MAIYSSDESKREAYLVRMRVWDSMSVVRDLEPKIKWTVKSRMFGILKGECDEVGFDIIKIVRGGIAFDILKTVDDEIYEALEV